MIMIMIIIVITRFLTSMIALVDSFSFRNYSVNQIDWKNIKRVLQISGVVSEG